LGPGSWNGAIKVIRPGPLVTVQDLGRPGLGHNFSAWTGFGVFAMHAAIALIGGIVAFRRRDA
jgi:allophanate hydrolase subunit 2